MTLTLYLHYISAMRKSCLGNIVIVMVGTKHPGNLGSVARAMFNMGLGRLRLAAPQCSITEESYRMAKGGKAILDNAGRFRSLRSALRGTGMVLGTSGKTGGHRDQADAPRELAQRILLHAARQKVGIVFGPEDTGLIDEDLLLCQRLIRIPTDPRARSINLAQAVMLVAYEIFVAQLPRAPARAPRLASIEQAEAMYAQIEEALLEIGFLQPQNALHMMFGLRRILGRAGLEARDVGIFRGIARQILWYGKNRTDDTPPAG